MAFSSRSLAGVRNRLPKLIGQALVDEAVAQSGYAHRRRKLGPLETILLCVSLILQRNASMLTATTQSGGAFTQAALCCARQRLTLALLAVVNQLLVERLLRDGVPRVVLLDCVNQYLPDTPALRRAYRRPGQKRRKLDYPQARSLCLVELGTGLMLGRHDFASDRHESPMLRHVLRHLRPGDTLVMDRGFASFANFCLLADRGIHFVARLPKGMHARDAGRRRFAHPGRRGSGQVTWDKPARRPDGVPKRRRWRSLPEQLALRQVSARVKGGRSPGRGRGGKVVLITDLAHASAKLIGTWYRRRWEIETDFRHVKQTLRLDALRSRTVAGVRAELALQMIAYNVVRTVMAEAARRRGVGAGRISFAAATTLLLSDPNIPLDVLATMPRRPRTSRPRRVKYQGKNYRLITSRPRPQRKAA
jgi:hypothetical protein